MSTLTLRALLVVGSIGLGLNAAVAEARLAAVPWATRCVRCQERQERLDNARIVRGPVSMRDGFESRFDDAA